MLITVTRTIPGSKFAKADLTKGDPRKSYVFIASMLSRVSKSARPGAPGGAVPEGTLVLNPHATQGLRPGLTQMPPFGLFEMSQAPAVPHHCG